MKILLFGKGGQVGWELQRSLGPLGTVVALDFDSTDLHANFAQPDQLAATVRAVQPDVIVNAAAHTAVDKAESEPDFARKLNADSPGVVAREAAALGAWLVHYSTDYVFDGSGSHFRKEDEATNPLSVYGRTKLDGEEAIRASGCKHVILRTSWVYASRGGNFARTMLKLAGDRDKLAVIDDQFGAPTGADLLADITAHVIRHAQRQPDVAGTYHAAASGTTNWHAYATLVIEWARARGISIKVPADAIAAVPTTSYPTPAKRPLNSRLDTTKLRTTFGFELPAWDAGVKRMLHEILNQP